MLYINASIGLDNIEVDLETYLALNVLNVCETKKISVKILRQDIIGFKISYDNFDEVDEVPEIATFCSWPVMVVGNRAVAGLCSVARQIIKSSENESVRHLLGFREACLMACSESSIWTKFCEVDFIKMVKNVVFDSHFELTDLIRFEYHLEQPIRMHNVYKYAREKHNDKDIKSSASIDELNINHTFSEGAFITLSDVILYSSLRILLKIFSESLLQKFPLIDVWLRSVQSEQFKFIETNIKKRLAFKEIDCGNIPRQSLYSSDPNRYKPQSRIYTKQGDIEKSLNIVLEANIKLNNSFEPYGLDVDFSWKDIPLEINPTGGALPKKRADRKSEQLENLTKAVIKISGDSPMHIVDFCSGSGHLGLLLAYLLPNSTIILVENKERSLQRAEDRVHSLHLNNVILLQTNLDYFIGKYDVGVALHACGVATDLVLKSCFLNRANFVVCPCCYGGVHECHHISYPRSIEFKDNINYEDYVRVAHAADQTHDKANVKTKQGYLCMDIIDSDRVKCAIEHGYEAYLGKMLPFDCTPKNNLLVGLFNGVN